MDNEHGQSDEMARRSRAAAVWTMQGRDEAAKASAKRDGVRLRSLWCESRDAGSDFEEIGPGDEEVRTWH